jgi:toluene monooxygenase system protein B
MALFPLVSNVAGDFVLQLLPVDTDDTMDQVAEKAAFHSIGRRVPAPPEGSTLRVREQGASAPFDRTVTVASSGLGPMACIEVYAE